MSWVRNTVEVLKGNWNYYKSGIKAGFLMWFVALLVFASLLGLALLGSVVYSVTGAWGLIPYLVVVTPVYFSGVMIVVGALEDYWREHRHD